MRLPRFVRSSAARTTMTNSCAQAATTATTIPCTYHGWVMLSRVPIPYSKLVERAKRVGVTQTVKSRSRKLECHRANVVIADGVVCIMQKTCKKGSTPLMHASIAMRACICTLISMFRGVAVIVAHTRDDQGQPRIGCVVIRLKSRRGRATFRASIQSSVDALHRHVLQERARQQAEDDAPPPPYTAHDPNFVLTQDVSDNRRMSIESFSGFGFDEPEDLE